MGQAERKQHGDRRIRSNGGVDLDTSISLLGKIGAREMAGFGRTGHFGNAVAMFEQLGAPGICPTRSDRPRASAEVPIRLWEQVRIDVFRF